METENALVTIRPPASQDWQAAYDGWKADSTPDNLAKVVGTVQPAIRYALSAVNGGSDPNMQVQAKIFAAKAIEKFDPASGASLPTWVSQQLMQLRRANRLSNAVAVPDRVQLDAFHLMRVEKEFIDKNNREPDLVELADRSGIPIKRIDSVRRIFRKSVSEGTAGTGEAPEVDYGGEALDYAYEEADHVDRKIIEMKTGYGGNYEPMLPEQIAKKLNISQAQISRRAARIALKVAEYQKELESP